MTARRRGNPGRQEREAGKRHRRGLLVTQQAAEWVTLKLGSKHLIRYFRRRNAMAVAESEKRAKGAPEIP